MTETKKTGEQAKVVTTEPIPFSAVELAGMERLVSARGGGATDPNRQEYFNLLNGIAARIPADAVQWLPLDKVVALPTIAAQYKTTLEKVKLETGKITFPKTKKESTLTLNLSGIVAVAARNNSMERLEGKLFTTKVTRDGKSWIKRQA